MSNILLPAPGVDDILMPSRRRWLCSSSAFIASLAVPSLAKTANFWDFPRELWLVRPETGEEVKVVYWADGRLIHEGYFAICNLLRDIHINRAVQFDLVTLDIARGVYGWLQGFNIHKPLIINSGYRHPTTNATEGGARNSLHKEAKAIDMRIEGVSTDSLTEFGMYLSGGGVGFYPSRNFTHLDRGRVRYWRG